LQSDIPGAARQVAAQSGAPEARVLIERLGRVEFASLYENARALGLSGRGAVTLATLFERTWRLWRASGVLSTPAPETAPLAAGVVAALVRGGGEVAPRPAPTVAAPRRGAAVLLVERVAGTRVDDTTVVDAVGLVAGVFEHASVQLGVRGGADRARALAADARERFDLPASRLLALRGPHGAGAATIEVLSSP
jgi:hypothetical protein